MKVKDKRIKLMNEVLSGIKVRGNYEHRVSQIFIFTPLYCSFLLLFQIIKLYAWEESFAKQINKYRKEELRLLRKANLLNALSSTLWFLSPILVSKFCALCINVLVNT